jgi:hypothetical protein
MDTLERRVTAQPNRHFVRADMHKNIGTTRWVMVEHAIRRGLEYIWAIDDSLENLVFKDKISGAQVAANRVFTAHSQAFQSVANVFSVGTNREGNASTSGPRVSDGIGTCSHADSWSATMLWLRPIIDHNVEYYQTRLGEDSGMYEDVKLFGYTTLQLVRIVADQNNARTGGNSSFDECSRIMHVIHHVDQNHWRDDFIRPDQLFSVFRIGVGDLMDYLNSKNGNGLSIKGYRVKQQKYLYVNLFMRDIVAWHMMDHNSQQDVNRYTDDFDLTRPQCENVCVQFNPKQRSKEEIAEARFLIPTQPKDVNHTFLGDVRGVAHAMSPWEERRLNVLTKSNAVIHDHNSKKVKSYVDRVVEHRERVGDSETTTIQHVEWYDGERGPIPVNPKKPHSWVFRFRLALLKQYRRVCSDVAKKIKTILQTKKVKSSEHWAHVRMTLKSITPPTRVTKASAVKMNRRVVKMGISRVDMAGVHDGLEYLAKRVTLLGILRERMESNDDTLVRLSASDSKRGVCYYQIDYNRIDDTSLNFEYMRLIARLAFIYGTLVTMWTTTNSTEFTCAADDEDEKYDSSSSSSSSSSSPSSSSPSSSSSTSRKSKSKAKSKKKKSASKKKKYKRTDGFIEHHANDESVLQSFAQWLFDVHVWENNDNEEYPSLVALLHRSGLVDVIRSRYTTTYEVSEWWTQYQHIINEHKRQHDRRFVFNNVVEKVAVMETVEATLPTTTGRYQRGGTGGGVYMHRTVNHVVNALSWDTGDEDDFEPSGGDAPQHRYWYYTDHYDENGNIRPVSLVDGEEVHDGD